MLQLDLHSWRRWSHWRLRRLLGTDISAPRCSPARSWSLFWTCGARSWRLCPLWRWWEWCWPEERIRKGEGRGLNRVIRWACQKVWMNSCTESCFVLKAYTYYATVWFKLVWHASSWQDTMYLSNLNIMRVSAKRMNTMFSMSFRLEQLTSLCQQVINTLKTWLKT